MAFSRLTSTFCRLIASAPRASEVVTIMGSISGVSPTATEMANSSASSQLPLVRPFSSSTAGAITAMKRISSRDTCPIPWSKAVAGPLSSPTLRASPPKTVPPPTATATARALPLTTVLPWKARQARSVRGSFSQPLPAGAAVFSTGSLSPVRAAWLMKRSRASKMRRSAGIISPAERWTMSPSTSSSMGSSCFWPARWMQQVVWSMADSFSATLALRLSCTKRSSPDTATITPMMPTVM